MRIYIRVIVIQNHKQTLNPKSKVEDLNVNFLSSKTRNPNPIPQFKIWKPKTLKYPKFTHKSTFVEIDQLSIEYEKFELKTMINK